MEFSAFISENSTSQSSTFLIRTKLSTLFVCFRNEKITMIKEGGNNLRRFFQF